MGTRPGPAAGTLLPLPPCPVCPGTSKVSAAPGLAGGIGPCEAVANEVKAGSGKRNAAFSDFAMKHAPEAKKSPSAVVRAARKEFPDFEKTIRALCR